MTLSAAFQSIFNGFPGSISADNNLNYNPDLLVQWNDIYFQILDQYQSRGLRGVRLAAKNIEDHIVSGRADLSKSVIRPEFQHKKRVKILSEIIQQQFYKCPVISGIYPAQDSLLLDPTIHT